MPRKDSKNMDIEQIKKDVAKWNEEMMEFFGSSIPTLGTASRSVDECVGFARKMLEGKDPLEKKRTKLSDELDFRGLAKYTPRKDDLVPYLYIKHGILAYPPIARQILMASPYGVHLRQIIDDEIRHFTQYNDDNYLEKEKNGDGF